MKKPAIILYGPPGSGKGTQANLLASKLNLIHFDTGKFFESVVYDPARQREPQVKIAQRQFETGILITPSFVLAEVKKAVTKIARAGFGVVFSGSPRTVYETERLMPVLEHLYGRENIFIFEFMLPAAYSIKRNSARLVCKDCGYMLLTAYYPKVRAKACPVCGGRFYKRSLDKQEIIKVRLGEYANRTRPVFGILRKEGYDPEKIDARKAPFRVLQEIVGIIIARSRGLGRKARATLAASRNIDFYHLFLS